MPLSTKGTLGKSSLLMDGLFNVESEPVVNMYKNYNIRGVFITKTERYSSGHFTSIQDSDTACCIIEKKRGQCLKRMT